MAVFIHLKTAMWSRPLGNNHIASYVRKKQLFSKRKVGGHLLLNQAWRKKLIHKEFSHKKYAEKIWRELNQCSQFSLIFLFSLSSWKPMQLIVTVCFSLSSINSNMLELWGFFDGFTPQHFIKFSISSKFRWASGLFVVFTL